MDCYSPELHLHLHSWHYEAKFNNRTPGFGFLCKTNDTVSLVTGVYHNSINQPSLYAGAVWQPWSVGPAKVGLYGGAVTGYKNYPIPFASGIVSVPVTQKTTLHTTIVPKVQGITPLTIHWSLSWRF